MQEKGPNELSVLENAKVELNDFLYYPNKIYEKYKNPRPTVIGQVKMAKGNLGNLFLKNGKIYGIKMMFNC